MRRVRISFSTVCTGLALCISAVGCSKDSDGTSAVIPPGEGNTPPGANCDGGFDATLPTACQCAPGCNTFAYGDGPGVAFDMDDPDSAFEGVAVDPETGGLVLAASQTQRAHIWISNTTQGTVSKIDTRSFVELGRYAMGPRAVLNADNPGECPVGASDDGDCEDPSRTSVNGDGDVYIALRSAGAVVKIAGDPDRCPDTNNDGNLTTSAGRENILAYGSDDCVLWRTNLPGNPRRVRAVAAQDEVGLDFTITPYVWVGDDAGSGTVWKLDGRTGAVLLTITNPPAAPYGMALDGRGQLWISGRNGAADANRHSLGRIDTSVCRANNCGGANYCDTNAAHTNCNDAPMERIGIGHNTYGITVDFRGRVWMALNGNNIANCDEHSVVRFDPRPEASGFATLGTNQNRSCTGRLQNCTSNLPADTAIDDFRFLEICADGTTRGVTADAEGNIFVAREAADVLRLNASDPRQRAAVANTNVDDESWGMATDIDGKIWAIGRGISQPIVFEPSGRVLDTNDIFLSGPYTYSDMTGSQLRFATNPVGTWRKILEGCSGGQSTQWQAVGFDAVVPGGTSLTVRARSAASRAALVAEDFVVVVNVPPGTSPASIASAFQEAGMASERYLEFEVRLTSSNQSLERILSPTLNAFDVGFTCNAGGGGLI